MVRNILDRAKNFIGLSEDGTVSSEIEEVTETKKEDIREVLRPKKTNNNNADCKYFSITHLLVNKKNKRLTI